MTVPAPAVRETVADVVVVGSGVAGLSAAQGAASRGLRVIRVAKSDDTATRYAQGGIAIGVGDDAARHVDDTVRAGAGGCDERAVRSIVGESARTLGELTAAGACFDRAPNGAFARTREGGHTADRIVHAGGDATGAEIQRALTGSASTGALDGTAVRVLTGPRGVTGLLVLSGGGEYLVVHAPAVILATGGAGQLFSCSTNPASATADGVALALRAGARVSDMEYVQFHPTVLFTGPERGRRPLISEAVRGEGATLVDGAGRPVTAGVHPMGDLAPRDVVSRAIAARMRSTGVDHVFLDATHLSEFSARFPTVSASCVGAGIDPARDLIPVAPAAHYSCGGVVTDTDGRTCVPGLYAAGETARTGMHGANRLASNSLLEAEVMGRRAGTASGERVGLLDEIDSARVDEVVSGRWSAPVVARTTLQDAMSEHAGVVRDHVGLTGLLTLVDSAEVRAVRSSRDVEDASLTLVASVLVDAALRRTETRGAHTRDDFPRADDAVRPSTVFRLRPDYSREVDRGATQRRTRLAGVS